MKIKTSLLFLSLIVPAGASDPIVKYDHCYGPSMLPRYGCVQAIKETFISWDDLHSGMVANSWDWIAQKYTNHRLMHKTKSGAWIKKGDNNKECDACPMTKNNYVCITEPCDEFKKY